MIYEENNYDSSGIYFVASSVKAALDRLIERHQEQVDLYKKMLEEVNPNNAHAERHRNIFSLNLQDKQQKLDDLKTHITSREWTDENIEDFVYEPYFYFNWHEVL